MPRLLAPVLTTLSLSVLFGAVTIVLYGALVPGGTGFDAQALALPAQLERTGDTVRRCPQCGWIEWKRKILPGGPDPDARLSYEYTVRMADGSSRVFREEAPISWRLGDRLIFIDGADPLSAPVAASSRMN